MEWNLIFYFSISMFIRHKQKIVPIEENYFKENKKWREWNFQIQYQDLVNRWEIFFKGSEFTRVVHFLEGSDVDQRKKGQFWQKIWCKFFLWFLKKKMKMMVTHSLVFAAIKGLL